MHLEPVPQPTAVTEGGADTQKGQWAGDVSHLVVGVRHGSNITFRACSPCIRDRDELSADRRRVDSAWTGNSQNPFVSRFIDDSLRGTGVELTSPDEVCIKLGKRELTRWIKHFQLITK